MPTRPDDEIHLRRAFGAARRARDNGNHPFGAILVGPDGAVLIETGNAVLPDGDATAHAERLLASAASRQYSAEFLATCTMYSSAEPCAMCAGALFWAGVRRIVFGLSGERLRRMAGEQPGNPMLFLASRTVFAAGQRPTEIIGPLLEDEAAALHDGIWN
ncbi:MAG: nucleoside deaminase [Pseudolabrys sp.]